MAEGIEVYDADGKLLIGIDSKLTRYIGEYTLSNNDFSQHTITSEGFTTGTPFFSIENKAFGSIPIHWDTFRDTYDTSSPYFNILVGFAVNHTKVTGSITGNTFTFSQTQNPISPNYNINEGIIVKYGVM